MNKFWQELEKATKKGKKKDDEGKEMRKGILCGD